METGIRRRLLAIVPKHPNAASDTVLGLVLSSFYDEAEIALVVEEQAEPDHASAERLYASCTAILQGNPLPNLILLGTNDIDDFQPEFTVTCSTNPIDAAQQCLMLSHWVLSTWTPAEHSSPTKLQVAKQAIIAERIANQTSMPTPVVAFIAQVQSTWCTLEDVFLHLRSSYSGITAEVVAIESDHENTELSTHEYMTRRGYNPRDVTWLQEQLASPESGLAAVVFGDPWDGLRPQAATAHAVASAGVDVFYIPYGRNVGAGSAAQTYAYNLPMHQIATKIYIDTKEQKQFFDLWCDSGSNHVAVLGSPKADRVMHALKHDNQAHEAPRFLWNPHFSVGESGWSTFLTYAEPMMDFFASHPECHLIFRPHFRIVRDSEHGHVELAAMLNQVCTFAEQQENCTLDTNVDYIESFMASTALVSDLSSLIPEYLFTEKPILYLHRNDSPGVNQQSDFFWSLDTASSWEEVEAFMLAHASGWNHSSERRSRILRANTQWEPGTAAANICNDIVNVLHGRDSSFRSPQETRSLAP